MDLKKEITRLENTLQQTRESEIGASAVFSGSLTESNTTNVSQHTEDSAFDLLRGIIQKTECSFVVIIDDMERLKFMFETEEAYFRFITAFARNVNESFNKSEVAFVITLDDKFARKVGSFDNPAIGDDNSFSFSALIEMKSFQPEHLVEIIKIRLEKNKWKGGINTFITKEAFWTLQYMTGGHARMALSAIRAAMEYIEFNELERKITSESLIAGFEQFRDKTPDSKLLPIITYLLKNGESSSSDAAFLKEIGISRPTMLRSLTELIARNCIQSTRPSGATEKQQYSVIELKNW